jgi:glycosyltransferase involved in cell wall biosynthesis
MTSRVVETLQDLGVPVVAVDTADRRGLGNIGHLDSANIAHGLRYTVRIWRASRRERPAATILPVSQSTLPLLRDALWAIAPVAMRSQLVLYLHGGALADFHATAPAPVRGALKWLGRHTWRAVVLTPGARRLFDGLVPDHRVRVLPNAVPDPGEPPPRSGRTRFRVVYLSNLVRGKGYLDLLEAAARLAPEMPDLEVVFAGEWYDGRDEAERRLASATLARCVRFAGIVTGDAKRDLLASADLFAFPASQPEGQPLALLEAMAAGLPILTTDSGLIPETVVDRRNAVLVRKRDPGALAGAIGALRENWEWREQLGRASRALYLERYTPDHFRRNLAALLAELPGPSSDLDTARPMPQGPARVPAPEHTNTTTL